MTKPQTSLITVSEIIKIVFVLIVFWLLYLTRDFLLLLFVSFIVASALNPLVSKIEKKKIPRSLAVFVVYVFFLLLLGGLLWLVVPPLVKQTQEFVSGLPIIADKVVALVVFWGDKVKAINFAHLLVENLLKAISGFAGDVPFHVLRVGKGIFSSILVVFTFFAISFYVLIEQRWLEQQFTFLFPEGRRERIRGLLSEVEKKLGSWLRGQAVLSLAVGFLVWIGLTLLQVEFSLPLAIISGLLEIIPIFGPLIAAIPAAIVGLSGGFLRGLSVIVLYWLIQQLENNLLVPLVMRETVGLDPLLVLVALIIGGRLLGVFGALLSVPIVATVTILIRYYRGSELSED